MFDQSCGVLLLPGNVFTRFCKLTGVTETRTHDPVLCDPVELPSRASPLTSTNLNLLGRANHFIRELTLAAAFTNKRNGILFSIIVDEPSDKQIRD